MAVLKAEPTKPIGSLDELMAMAHAMEKTACVRYADLADRMRDAGFAELGALFDDLVGEEKAHVRSVESWAERELGHPPSPTDVRWIPPDTFDEEAAVELASSRLASPYRVLSMAVRNEERAFLVWTYIASQAEREDVRQAAERMAHEEMSHVSRIRRARRKAYHAERRARTAPRSVADRIVAAARGEHRMAAQLDRLAAESTGAFRHEALAMAAEARTMAAALPAADAGFVPSAESPLDEIATAESLVEDYLDIADHSRDEATVSHVQSMARLAIRRLGWLRTIAAERPPRGTTA